MHTITLRIPFCAGHRLLGHKGKCRHLHGHNYTAIISVRRPDFELDEMGMVIDFGDLKAAAKGWIDANWDHNMVLNAKDPLLQVETAVKGDPTWVNPDEFVHDLFGGKRPFIMPYNPTAENMARHLAQALIALLPDTKIIRVEIQETESSSATFS